MKTISILCACAFAVTMPLFAASADKDHKNSKECKACCTAPAKCDSCCHDKGKGVECKACCSDKK